MAIPYKKIEYTKPDLVYQLEPHQLEVVNTLLAVALKHSLSIRALSGYLSEIQAMPVSDLHSALEKVLSSNNSEA